MKRPPLLPIPCRSDGWHSTQATLLMAYIAMPQMQIQVTHQRSTCLDLTPTGERYRFESLEHGSSTFTAELSVDQDGLVLDYPGLFRRVAMT